jgi:pimeloyl-ACP methyl ester carboxylesterase
MTLIVMAAGFALLWMAVAFRANLWGLHPLPRSLPRASWLLPAVAGSLLFGVGLSRMAGAAGLLSAVAAIGLGGAMTVALSCLVVRDPCNQCLVTRDPCELAPLVVDGHQDGEPLFIRPRGWTGCVVVLAHGGGNDRFFGFWYLIEVLLSRGHAVLTAHLPGHGQRGSDEFSVEAGRARLDALVTRGRELEGTRRVLLLGQSLGGSFALDLAARGGRVDAIIALSAPAELRVGIGVVRELRALSRRPVYRALRYGNAWQSLPAAGRFKRRSFPVRVPRHRPYLAAFTHALGELDLVRRLSQHPGGGCPILLVHGLQDAVVPVAQATALKVALGYRGELRLHARRSHLDLLYDRGVVEDIAQWIEEVA